eukprot:jgi/Chlat1/6828/Chrsp51S06517
MAGSGAGAGAGAAPSVHCRYCVWDEAERMVVQPTNATSSASASSISSAASYLLAVDRADGHISLIPNTGDLRLGAAKDDASSTTTTTTITQPPLTIFGIIGIIRLLAGPYLLVITGREQVGTLRGDAVYRITKAKIVPCSPGQMDTLSPAQASGLTQRRDEGRYLSMVQYSLSSPYLYFSYHGDITLHTAAAEAAVQRAGDKPIWQRADERFFWNWFLVQPLIQQQGFASTTVKGLPLAMALLSRRSTHRIGMRLWRRGIDAEGDVANFVETEQLINVNGMTASYVRGSIPLVWMQAPNLKYKPTYKAELGESTVVALRKHINALVDKYSNIVLVDLVNQHGSENMLGAVFAKELAALNQPTAQYVPFDYHHNVGLAGFAKLNKLYALLEQNFTKFGFYLADSNGKALRVQSGVIRSNCIDCLDRTNVVQSYFAYKALEQQLVAARVFEPGETVEQHAGLSVLFKNVWADHGDAISMQYTGTGALKGDVTRTGVRTLQGAVNDGVNALSRYYLNNFCDGFRQDSCELVTGKYLPDPKAPSPFVKKGIEHLASPMIVPIAAVAGVWMTVMALASAVASSEAHAYLSAFLWALLAAVAVAVMKKHGRELVDKPRLNRTQKR